MTELMIHNLTNRLDDLERQNRRLKRGGFGLALGALAMLTIGALPDEADNRGNALFDTIRARRVVISDNDGQERLILELDAGEPTLRMINHHGQPQIYLGIDERWQDTAYLSVSSRLENGDVDKQAVLAVTSSHPNSPGNSQLVLYDAKPQQKNAASRHLVRLSSGLSDQKPYLEIHESSQKGASAVNLDLLRAKPVSNGQRVLLDTNPDRATMSGVQVQRRKK